MGDCEQHGLMFMPYSKGGDPTFHILVSNALAGVVDLTCPKCGHTLFIYYRHAPPEGGTYERNSRTVEYDRGTYRPEPQSGPQQQKEGNEK